MYGEFDDSPIAYRGNRALCRRAGRGKDLGFFERYLTIWVALRIVAGVALGQLVPAVPDTLARFTYAEVNIPVAILIWFMIYPMMVQIDFASILGVRKQPRGWPLPWRSTG